MARDDDRGVRDQAGIGPDPTVRAERLVPMRSIKDFKIADGEPDIRSWDVYSSAGAFIGEVHDLLVDPELGQVVLLEIDLKDAEQYATAPIKAGWLDRERKRVIVDSAQLDRDVLAHRARRGDTADEVVVTRVDDDTVIVDETTRRGPAVDPAATDRRDDLRL